MAIVLLGFVEMILAIFLSSLLYFIFHFILNRSSQNINWPFVGMLPGLLSNTGRIHEYLTQFLKQSDDHTKLFKGPWFSNMDFVITCDPINVNHILSKNFANYPKGSQFRMIMEPLGDGIINIDGEPWRIQRKSIASLIKQSKFDDAVEKVYNKKLEKSLIPVLEHVSKHGIVVDMQDLLQRFTFDSVCLLVLGLGFDPGCLTVDLPKIEYATAFDDIEEALLYRHAVPESIWRLQKWLDMGEEKKLKKASETFDKFIYNCISLKRERILNSRKRERNALYEDEFDLITSFMVDEDEDGEKSDKIVRDVAFNLLAAGRDTVSVGLTWFLWLVATHSSIESKILEEMKANVRIRKLGDEISMFDNVQDLNKLIYLHATICEALRLYPPVPINHKTARQPDTLPSGQHIGKNTKILISHYAMARIEDIWGKDCYEFKPERWISEEGCIRRIPSYKYTVFSSGPRTCVGKDLSLIQMKMVAFSVIWNYQLQVVEGHPIVPRDSVILQMQHGLKIRVCKRQVL